MVAGHGQFCPSTKCYFLLRRYYNNSIETPYQSLPANTPAQKHTHFYIRQETVGAEAKKSEKDCNRISKHFLYYSDNLESEKQMRQKGQHSAFFPMFVFYHLASFDGCFTDLKLSILRNAYFETGNFTRKKIYIYVQRLFSVSFPGYFRNNPTGEKKKKFLIIWKSVKMKISWMVALRFYFFRELQSHSKL